MQPCNCPKCGLPDKLVYVVATEKHRKIHGIYDGRLVVSDDIDMDESEVTHYYCHRCNCRVDVGTHWTHIDPSIVDYLEANRSGADTLKKKYSAIEIFAWQLKDKDQTLIGGEVFVWHLQYFLNIAAINHITWHPVFTKHPNTWSRQITYEPTEKLKVYRRYELPK